MASTLKVNTIAHSGGTDALTIDSTGRVLTPARPMFYATMSAGTAANNVLNFLCFRPPNEPTKILKTPTHKE